MSELDHISIRVKRDGRWQSKFINELDYITAEEIKELSWGFRLRDMLRADPTWKPSDEAFEWVRTDKT